MPVNRGRVCKVILRPSGHSFRFAVTGKLQYRFHRRDKKLAEDKIGRPRGSGDLCHRDCSPHLPFVANGMILVPL